MQHDERVPLLSSDFRAPTSARMNEHVPQQMAGDGEASEPLPGATSVAGEPAEATGLRDSLRNRLSTLAKAQAVDQEFSHNDKLIYYDHEGLLSWRAVFALGGNALLQPAVWQMGVSVIVIAAVTALIVVNFVPMARAINTQRFNLFLGFLKIFISFMLGIYVQNAFKRWHGALTQFEKYLVSIKQMLCLFHSIHVDPETIAQVQRQAIAASYILNTEIHNLQTYDKDAKRSMSGTLNWLRDETRLLRHQEHAKLHEVTAWKQSTKAFGTLAVSCTAWSWIGEQVSRAKLSDGSTPAPPMHVRVLALCQECMGRVEELKMNIVTQVPYMYAQLLSFLVYVNNLLLAISSGLIIGSSMAEIRSRSAQLSQPGSEDNNGKHMSRVGEFYEACQVAGIQMMIVVVEPMLYVAFLNIAHNLCYPYGDKRFHLPTESFIARLHVELHVLKKGREWSKERRASYEREGLSWPADKGRLGENRLDKRGPVSFGGELDIEAARNDE